MIYPVIKFSENMGHAIIDLVDTNFSEPSFISIANDTVEQTCELFLTLVIAFTNQYDCGFDDGYDYGYDDAEEDFDNGKLV